MSATNVKASRDTTRKVLLELTIPEISGILALTMVGVV